MEKVIAVVNQKGGVGKSTTCFNLGIGLAKYGNKKVLLIDNDPQGSLTISLGYERPDDLSISLCNIINEIILQKEIKPNYGILNHIEGVDLMPANIELAGIDNVLMNEIGRENILRQYIECVQQNYDYIIIDCMPSLGILTINALAAASSVLIPVQAQFLAIKGLEQLLVTISKIKRQINHDLSIEGILLTMVNNRTNYSKESIELLNTTYGNNIKIFKHNIPMSVRVSESSSLGKSIFHYDPYGKATKAYKLLVEEILHNETSKSN